MSGTKYNENVTKYHKEFMCFGNKHGMFQTKCNENVTKCNSLVKQT